jgi:hypothetical protein
MPPQILCSHRRKVKDQRINPPADPLPLIVTNTSGIVPAIGLSMSIVQAILVSLVPGALIAILAAWLSVRLSLRQFHSQRWWEKKVDTYTHIVQQLSNLNFHYRERYREWSVGRDFNDKYRNAVREAYSEGSESIRKAASAGAFFISPKTATVLQQLVEDLDKAAIVDNPYESIEIGLNATQKCLDSVRQYATDDLKDMPS